MCIQLPFRKAGFSIYVFYKWVVVESILLKSICIWLPLPPTPITSCDVIIRMLFLSLLLVVVVGYFPPQMCNSGMHSKNV